MTAINGGVESGIVWATCQAPCYGAVNGYVKVPDGHPWYGLDYEMIDVEVHGGLTFARDGWIGFDTLHLGDVWPGVPETHFDHGGRRWTPDLVAAEARSLARKVAEVGHD
ncbi:hypothetical protein [Gordonia terrae]